MKSVIGLVLFFAAHCASAGCLQASPNSQVCTLEGMPVVSPALHTTLENQGATRVSTSPPLGAFTLITVTYGGDVGHSRDYRSLRMCEQARSLALTGETLEQAQQRRDAILKAQQERDDEWKKAHPPRTPTAKDLKTCADLRGKKGTIVQNSAYCTIEQDGLVHEYRGPDWWTSGAEMSAGPPNGRIKHAECVQEPGKQP